MTGQIRITTWDRTVARALHIEDPQLVADVTDVLGGHTPSYEDVMDIGHYWGTTPTGTLERIIANAFPMPPEGWGLTTHENQVPPRGRRTRLKGRS